VAVSMPNVISTGSVHPRDNAYQRLRHGSLETPFSYGEQAEANMTTSMKVNFQDLGA
jgi:hypothetical protein